MEEKLENTKDTKKIAQDFFSVFSQPSPLSRQHPNLNYATVVGLSGELGAGKTHFVQAIAKCFGVKQKLASPTFVIMKRYKLKNQDFENLFHIDAYRLKSADEMLKLGWVDILKNPKNIIFIEWPENISKIIPKKHIKIKITYQKNQTRKFSIKML